MSPTAIPQASPDARRRSSSSACKRRASVESPLNKAVDASRCVDSVTFARAGYAALPLWEGPLDSHAGPLTTAQDYPLVLTFLRLVQFGDEQHRNIPRLRRQAPHPLLEIHPARPRL